MMYLILHINYVNYADIVVITDSLVFANILQHQRVDKAEYIGLHINSDKTEYMCLNHENRQT